MNVLFHTLAGGAIAVLLAPQENTKSLSKGLRCASAFVLGILSHGLLDWAPHCYPIASKVDVIVSLAIMIFAFFRSAKAFRPILIAAFVGAILPDVLDLSPAILAKQTGWNVPVFPHFFPWHWKEYSGSVYNGDCATSNWIHLLLVIVAGLVFWRRRKALN